MALPSASDFWTQESEGRNRQAVLHDNTLALLIHDTATKIVGRLIPADTPWLQIKVGELNRNIADDETRHFINSALENISRFVMAQFDRSNFQSALTLLARHFLTFGYCGCIPRWDMVGARLRFSPAAVTKMWLEKGGDNDDVSVFWRRKYIGRDIIAMYGDQNGKIRDTSEYMVNYGVIPKGAFCEVWAWCDNMIFLQLEKPGREMVLGMLENEDGYTYPVEKSFGAINYSEAGYANFMARAAKRLAMMSAAPPMVADIETFVSPAEVRGEPNGITMADLRAAGGVNNVLAPMNTGARPEVALQQVNDARAKMRENMGVTPDLSQADAPRGETATAWLIAQEQARENIKGMTDIFRDKVLVPLVQQAILILQQHTGFPPAELAIDGANYKMKIQGESERQRDIFEMQRINALIEAAGVNPVGSITLNHAALMRRQAEILGHSKLLLPPSVSNEIAARAQQEQGGAQGGGAAA